MTTDQALIPVEQQVELTKALTWASGIRALNITTAEQHAAAVQQLAEARGWIDRLEKWKLAYTKEKREWVSNVNAKVKFVTDALANAAKVISLEVGRYQLEQQRKHEEEQKKREIEAAAERRRLEEKAVAEQQKAALYAEQGRNNMAEKAAARAEAIMQQAIATVAVEVPDEKPDGLTLRNKWVAKIVDHAKAVAACMARPELQDLVSIDLKAIEKMQNAAKGKMVIDGIEWHQEAIVAARRKENS